MNTTDDHKRKIPWWLFVLIALGCLKIIPWWMLALFITAFAFDAPGSTSNPGVLVTVAAIWSYPLFPIACSLASVWLAYRGVRRWLVALIGAGPVLLAFLFLIFSIFMLNEGRYDPLEIKTITNKEQRQFIKACAHGSVAKVSDLLHRGADPNMTGSTGMNPLLAAYIGRNFEVFQLLLENGANPNKIPASDIYMNVAGYIVGDLKEDWKPDGLPYMEMLLTKGLNVHLSNGGNNPVTLLFLAGRARNKEYGTLLTSAAEKQAKAQESR